MIIKNTNELKRYTNLPSLLYILKEKVITLRDPNYWEDRNDAESMNSYQCNKYLKTLLAVCFTETTETYHHWHVFAGDVSGVCITFKKDILLKCFNKSKGFNFGSVQYKTLEQMRKQMHTLEEIPFIKRFGYRDEREFRIIYENKTKSIPSIDVAITIDCIDKVVLTSLIPKIFKKSIIEVVKSINGCERLSMNISRSTLTESVEWKKLVSNVK